MFVRNSRHERWEPNELIVYVSCPLLSWINIMKMFLQKESTATPHSTHAHPHNGTNPMNDRPSISDVNRKLSPRSHSDDDRF